MLHQAVGTELAVAGEHVVDLHDTPRGQSNRWQLISGTIGLLADKPTTAPLWKSKIVGAAHILERLPLSSRRATSKALAPSLTPPERPARSQDQTSGATSLIRASAALKHRRDRLGTEGSLSANGPDTALCGLALAPYEICKRWSRFRGSRHQGRRERAHTQRPASGRRAPHRCRWCKGRPGADPVRFCTGSAEQVDIPGPQQSGIPDPC
jgi:hypothetical protein